MGVITNSNQIFGQDQVISFLKNFLSVKSIPKIIWLTGESGSGKSTIAEWFALAATCETNTTEPCLHCKTCEENMRGFNSSIVKSKTIRKINLAELLSKKEIKEVIEQIFDFKTFDNRRTFFILEEMQELAGQENLFLERMRQLPDNVYIIGCTTNLKALSVPFQTRASLTLNISRLNKTSAKELAQSYARSNNLTLTSNEVNLLISKSRNNARVITQTLDLMIKNKSDVKSTLRLALNYIDLDMYITLFENLFKDFPNFILYLYSLQEEINLTSIWLGFHQFLIDVLYYLYANTADVFSKDEKVRLEEIRKNITQKQLKRILTVASKYTQNENTVVQYFLDINNILNEGEPLTVVQNGNLVAQENLMVQKETIAKSYEIANLIDTSNLTKEVTTDLINRDGTIYDTSSIINLL